MKSKDHTRWFAISISLLTCISVGYLIYSGSLTSLPKADGDGTVYENIGFHLWQGRGFYFDMNESRWRSPYEAHGTEYQLFLQPEMPRMPTTARPPLLPLLIAATYSLVGRNEVSFAIVRLSSALCIALAGAMSTWLTVKILSARSQLLGAKPGWVIGVGALAALLFAATNRTLLTYSQDFLTEPLALVLTQLLVVLWFKRIEWTESVSVEKHQASSRQSRWVEKLLIAITLASMIYARSLFVLWLPGVWLMWILADRGSIWQRVRSATVVMLLTILLLSPWWVRNCLTLDRWMPLGTQGPITLLGGYCDEAIVSGGDWCPEPESRLRAEVKSERANFANDLELELLIVDKSKHIVRSWMSSHSDELPELFFARVVTHWNPYTGRALVWKLAAIVGAFWIIMNSRRAAVVLLGTLLLNTLIVGLLYSTGGRFLVPLYGVLCTLAGIGAAWLVSLLTNVTSKNHPTW